MYEVVGIKPVQFTAQDGKEVKGHSIFCLWDDENDKDVEGKKTDKFFVKILPDGLEVGDQIDVRFNRYGKVERIDTF